MRQFLLGQLNEELAEQVELRLLSEAAYADEFDVIVDEITDQYVAGEFQGAERQRVEDYFFKSADRREQLKFARALHQARKEHESEPDSSKPTSDTEGQSRGAGPVPLVISPEDGVDDSKVDSIKQNTVRQLSSKPWQPSPYTAYLKIAASVIILLGLPFGVWRVFFYQSDVDKGLLALNAAYRDQRPIEARISGLSYAPLPNTRGAEELKVNNLSLNLAERILLDEVDKHPSARTHHASGLLYLAERKFDEAIAQFEAALKDEPNNGRLHSDLGAALLEKGKSDRLSNSGKGFEELAVSLEHLNKALALDGSLLEALFNRALLHEEMMLTPQAEQDWKQYLEKDSASKWADEARTHLRLLAGPKKVTSQTKEELLQEFLNARTAGDNERAWQVISHSREALSGKQIWEQLLVKYLDAEHDGRRSDAENVLQALSYEGELENRRAGDRFVSGLADFYRKTSPAQRSLLVEAHQAMKVGHEYYSQVKLDSARDAYSKAHQIFAANNDEWETEYAQHWIGYTYYEQGKSQQGLEILERLAATLQKENRQWLLMRTLHIASSAYHNLNEYSKAINYNRRALALAERINDKIGIFNASRILIFQYGSMGNHREAFAHVQLSLSIMNECPLNEIQAAGHFNIVAIAFETAGLYHAAIDYQKEALRRAVAISNTQHTSLDYARLGLMYGEIENFKEAHANLNLAYNTAQSESNEDARKGMMAFSALQMGQVYRVQGEFSNAITSYNQSIALSEHFHFKYDIYEAHKNRLVCYLAVGNDAAASDELKTTLDLADKYRSTIVEEENRNGFYDIQQSVYDLAIDFSYSRMKDSRQAFQYSEDSRSRSLLESVNGNTAVVDDTRSPDIDKGSGTAQPFTLSEIQSRLPANVQLVQYAVLSKKLLIWVISRDSFSPFESDISQPALQKKVEDYLRFVAAQSDADEEKAAARELFDILIKPVQSLLEKSRPIYLVPDKFLNSLPFAALISPAGSYLLEDYQVENTPSSTLLILFSENADKKAANVDERILSVGNPRFDLNDFPSLRNLPASARESQKVATYYRSRHVLTGPAATLGQVTSEMPDSEVIHLALHSVTDDKAPMHSKLVLAKNSSAENPESNSDGSLEAYKIYQLKLPRTRLAVLSACRTGSGRTYGGEGTISLARPFLAAGVPLMVVSLWPVDSDATAELMISFHKHRKQDNVSSREALRQAQLEMIRRPEEQFRHVFSWGAFVLIGGSASF